MTSIKRRGNDKVVEEEEEEEEDDVDVMVEQTLLGIAAKKVDQKSSSTSNGFARLNERLKSAGQTKAAQLKQTSGVVIEQSWKKGTSLYMCECVCARVCVCLERESKMTINIIIIKINIQKAIQSSRPRATLTFIIAARPQRLHCKLKKRYIKRLLAKDGLIWSQQSWMII